MLIGAHGEELVNATVSNAASSAASALYGANGKAVGGIIAMNKVRSDVRAWYELGTTDVTGAFDVIAEDAAGIFANVKMVSSSVTSNDGGVGIAQDYITNAVDFQYSNNEGLRWPQFGERVRIATGSIFNDFTSDDSGVDLTLGTRVQVSDDYGSYRLTSKFGRRLLITGDNVLFELGYGLAGDDGAVYRYLGPNGRVDLGAEDYTDTNRWAKLGGEPGATYRYVGADVSGVDLRNVDYTTSDWEQVGGVEGGIYQWMGPDVDTSGPGIDLSNQNYLDLLRWKPVLATSLLPSGINVTDSNATSVGWIVVYNDVRSSVEALISHADVTADSVSVVADLAALIRSTADISGVSSGGNSLNNGGTSLALGFVIATNVILSKVLATIESSRVTARSGSIVVRAGNVSQIDAEALNSIESAGEGAGVTLAFNSIGWNSQNILFNLIDTILGDPLIAGAFGNANPAEATALVHNSTLTAGADVDVSAITEATINATVSNKATTTVVVITGSTALAVGVAIASNMVNSTASATIEFDTPDAGDATLVEAGPGKIYEWTGADPRGPPANGDYATDPNYRLVSSVTAGGSVTVHAEDAAGIFATVEVISIATAESTFGLDLVANLVGAAQTDYQYTTYSGTQFVKPGELLRADDGSVYRFNPADPDTYVPVAIDLTTTLASSPSLWKLVNPLSSTYDDLSALGLTNLSSADATAASGLASRNDVRGGAFASITNMTIDADGDVAVTALETATIRAKGDSVAQAKGGSLFDENDNKGMSFQIATNVMLSGARATVTDSVIVAGGDVTVSAENTSTLEALMTTIVESPQLAIGATLAFNSIGWDSQNILFNLADAVLGLGIGDENPAVTIATVTGSTIDAGGAISVTATSLASIVATVETAATTFSASLTSDSSATGVDIVVAMNRVSTQVSATISNAPAVPGGTVGPRPQRRRRRARLRRCQHLLARHGARARRRGVAEQLTSRGGGAQHLAQRGLDLADRLDQRRANGHRHERQRPGPRRPALGDRRHLDGVGDHRRLESREEHRVQRWRRHRGQQDRRRHLGHHRRRRDPGHRFAAGRRTDLGQGDQQLDDRCHGLGIVGGRRWRRLRQHGRHRDRVLAGPQPDRLAGVRRCRPDARVGHGLRSRPACRPWRHRVGREHGRDRRRGRSDVGRRRGIRERQRLRREHRRAVDRQPDRHPYRGVHHRHVDRRRNRRLPGDRRRQVAHHR